MNDVTHLLTEIQRGKPQAAEQLLPLVYDELRRLARARLAKEKPGHTLNATGLVHEAYLRLIGPSDERGPQWDGRGHFFAAAAEAMRRILVESARRKRCARHGGDLQRVELHEDSLPVRVQASDEDILTVHEALAELEPTDPQAAQLVKLHYFLGLPFAEAAQLLGISERTAYRTWSYARAWLFKRFADRE